MLGTNNNSSHEADVSTELPDLEENVKNDERSNERWEYYEDFCPCVLGSESSGLFDDDDDDDDDVTREEIAVDEMEVVEKRVLKEEHDVLSIGLL